MFKKPQQLKSDLKASQTTEISDLVNWINAEDAASSHEYLLA